eukprot:Skav207718  [mRNA]  locus=scaffold1347:144348:145483:- [translate_table: standard]
MKAAAMPFPGPKENGGLWMSMGHLQLRLKSGRARRESCSFAVSPHHRRDRVHLLEVGTLERKSVPEGCLIHSLRNLFAHRHRDEASEAPKTPEVPWMAWKNVPCRSRVALRRGKPKQKQAAWKLPPRSHVSPGRSSEPRSKPGLALALDTGEEPWALP